MRKKKSERTILLSSEPVRTWKDFWARIFFGREASLAEKAELVFNLIKEGKIESSKWKEIIQDLELKTCQYYHILSSMQKVGMVDYDYSEKKYKASDRFCEKLKELERYAK